MTDNENIERIWKPEFLQYTETIVNHPNYRGLFFERGSDGRVKWVVTGKSPKGQLRLEWWNEQCRRLNIPIQKGCYAIAARHIHPTKMHVCQCCGRSLSIYYVYPNKTFLGQLNQRYNVNYGKADLTISEWIENFCNTDEDILFFAVTFKLPSVPKNKKELQDIIYNEYHESGCKKLSAGVFCNPPDRYDGFHSDGLCCREKTDKGRNPENMKTYIQDRRAYEEWADGDYNLANHIMGEFQKYPDSECPLCHNVRSVSADHIGPISLGFCHSVNFAPMCPICNRTKNNRFSYSDVQKLIEIEQHGQQVISWHSKAIWDLLKNHIGNDKDAKKASSVMSTCHQNVLKMFSIIYLRSQNGRTYLKRFFHPEYSMYDYRFENFNPYKLTETTIIKKPCDSKNKQSNQERYERIAFESLEAFDEKDNRRAIMFVGEVSSEIEEICRLVDANMYDEADIQLSQTIIRVSELIKKAMWDN